MRIIDYNKSMLSTSELWEKYGDESLRDGLTRKLRDFLTPIDGQTISEEGIFYIGKIYLLLTQSSASHLYSYLSK